MERLLKILPRSRKRCVMATSRIEEAMGIARKVLPENPVRLCRTENP
jgi:hypothetical protein